MKKVILEKEELEMFFDIVDDALRIIREHKKEVDEDEEIDSCKD